MGGTLLQGFMCNAKVGWEPNLDLGGFEADLQSTMNTVYLEGCCSLNRMLVSTDELCIANSTCRNCSQGRVDDVWQPLLHPVLFFLPFCGLQP